MGFSWDFNGIFMGSRRFYGILMDFGGFYGSYPRVNSHRCGEQKKTRFPPENDLQTVGFHLGYVSRRVKPSINEPFSMANS